MVLKFRGVAGSEAAVDSGEKAPRRDTRELERALGYEFQDKELLRRALTHRSAAGREGRADYERLEYLGDAVLDLVVADLLLAAHPDAREGELSKMRAALVNTRSLAEIASDLSLQDFVILSKGEYAQGGHERPSILADVVESVVGSLYREAGYETAYVRIRELFGSRVETVLPTDPKTELQELLHTMGSSAPVYLLERVEGPEHAPTFVSVVEIDSKQIGTGQGATKKESQQEAARVALMKLQSSDDEIDAEYLEGGVDE